MITEVLWSLVFGAIVVEAIVNIVNNLEERNTCWKYWTALGVSIGLGLVISLNYSIDVFKLAGLEGTVPFIGAILTGLIISRGSNIVSDIVDRLNSWRASTN